MDDVERLIRETLRAEECRAPAATALLAGVRARSRRLHRRRVVGGTVALLAVAGASVAVPVVVRQAATSPNAIVVASTPATGPAGTPGPAPASTTVTLASGRQPSLAFPYRLDRAIAARMRPSPVISLDGGTLSATYEAQDQWGDADVVIALSTGRPTFPAPAGKVREVRQTVRGREGWLRTVAVSPAAELTLYWQERAGQWVQLRTDDTYSERQVLEFAEGLTAGRLVATAPFTFDPAPVGMVPGTLTDATVGFRPAHARSGADVLVCTLLTRRPLRGTPVEGSGLRAALSRDARGTTLMVDEPEENAVLMITLRPGYQLRESELLRFAAGARFTDRADPAASPVAR